MTNVSAHDPRVRKPHRLIAALSASLTFVLLTCAAYSSVVPLAAAGAYAQGWRSLVWGVVAALAMYGFPIGTSLMVYHALRGPILAIRGETYCGICGYRLNGLTEPRCSECGRSI